VGRARVSILLIQHDATEAVALAKVLEQAGFQVTVALGRDVSELIDAAAPDVMVIGNDLELDYRVQLCMRLRVQGFLGAIVVLGAVTNEVAALVDAGADDFVLEPIQASEVVVRVQMALRRVVAQARWRWGPVEIDRVRRTCSLRGQMLTLTAREYALLSCLLEAGGEVMSRADLLSKVCGGAKTTLGSNLLEVHLSRLRDKLGADANMIETVRRAGYRLRPGAGRRSHP
jgi:DNA-binding response OmpR family regulator